MGCLLRRKVVFSFVRIGIPRHGNVDNGGHHLAHQWREGCRAGWGDQRDRRGKGRQRLRLSSACCALGCGQAGGSNNRQAAQECLHRAVVRFPIMVTSALVSCSGAMVMCPCCNITGRNVMKTSRFTQRLNGGRPVVLQGRGLGFQAIRAGDNGRACPAAYPPSPLARNLQDPP